MTVLLFFSQALDESQAFKEAWLCCIYMSQDAAFDIMLFNSRNYKNKEKP